MLQVEEAQALVLAEIVPVEPETIPFAETLGRVLREDVAATRDLPPADNSAMDGYAVRVEDVARVPVTLRVTGDIAAGHPTEGRVEGGTAMRIMTGAYLPDGADTVVQLELTAEWRDGTGRAGALPETVTILESLSRGKNVRPRGEDVRAGAIVLRDGSRIGPAEMAVLAAFQHTTVRVGRRPTVAILSTGDELVEIDEPLPPGKIVNSNSHLLVALVREAGAIPRPLPIVRDTREATIAALEAALESDFILTTGGVSVGAFDFVKEALEALGAETRFWRVAMKPGKPVVLSRLRNSLVLGLPGNPASCFVSFHLFVAPALRKAAGRSAALLPPSVRTRLAAPLRSPGDRRNYLRAIVEARGGELFTTPLASQGSGSLTSMAGANGLAIVPAGVQSMDAGEWVDTVILGC